MTIQALTALTEELEALQKKFAEQGKTVMHGALRELFDAHPLLSEIRWTQYTPYFNDGDECVFGVHAAEYILNDEELDAYGDPRETWDSQTRTVVAVESPDPACVAVYEFSLRCRKAKEVMQAVFGDHVQVVATREGISVDSYDHD